MSTVVRSSYWSSSNTVRCWCCCSAAGTVPRVAMLASRLHTCSAYDVTATGALTRPSAVTTAPPRRHSVLPTRKDLSESHTVAVCRYIDKVKVKADDLYRGSMQSEDHRRTALQYPPCSLDPMPLPTIRHFLHEGPRKVPSYTAW